VAADLGGSRIPPAPLIPNLAGTPILVPLGERAAASIRRVLCDVALAQPPPRHVAACVPEAVPVTTMFVPS
jgi:hypothetical protein